MGNCDPYSDPSEPMVVMQPKCTVEGADIVMQSSKEKRLARVPEEQGCITFPLAIPIHPGFLTLCGRGKYTSWFGFAL